MNRLDHMDNSTIARILEEVNDEADNQGDYANSLGLHNFRVTDGEDSVMQQ